MLPSRHSGAHASACEPGIQSHGTALSVSGFRVRAFGAPRNDRQLPLAAAQQSHKADLLVRIVAERTGEMRGDGAGMM